MTVMVTVAERQLDCSVWLTDFYVDSLDDFFADGNLYRPGYMLVVETRVLDEDEQPGGVVLVGGRS